jgi:hypothetical protein
MPNPDALMMIASLIKTVPMTRIGGMTHASNEEQNDRRSHDTQQLHGVPLWLVDEAPQWRPSLAQMFKRWTQTIAAPAGDPWGHEQWRGAARNLPKQRAVNGQAEIGFRRFLPRA